MATKTVINCMDHHSSITQPNQGISIIIDQHMDDQNKQQQQVYETSSMQNAKIIKIQHSIEQPPPQYLTLNNRKNNKTLIDIKRNNDFDDDQQQQKRNDHVLQINCTSNTSNEFTSREIKEILENIENNTSKLEYNGSFEERRRNVDLEGEQQMKLAKDESFKKYSNTQIKRVKEKDVEEESGQTASQKQKQQQILQLNNTNNNENGNSKHRENGQNSTMTTITTSSQIKLNLTKLSKHNEEELKNNVNEDHKHHNEQQLDHNNVINDDDDLETPHNKEVTNREDDNDSNSNSSGISSISGGISLIQREVIGDFSHGKRSLYEENSNSLLTKADAITSTTLLTINANNVNTNSQQKVTTSKVLNNFENLTNDKKIINHVVKIQIKPNNNNSSDNINTLTEKQITVVKIENLQKPLIEKVVEEVQEEKAKEFENEINTSSKANENKVTSEIIENKENLKTENATSVIKQSQLNVLATTTTTTAAVNMVQKPSNNCNNNTVTMVGTHANNNGNANVSQSNNNGAVTASTVTELNVSNPNNYLYYMMSSGQFSPCDTLDSGTGSDLESNGQQQQTSPNLQTKKSSNSSAASTTSTASNGSITPLELHLKTTKIRVANSTSNSLDLQQTRQCSFTDSEESEASSLSCDSLHSNEFLRQSSTSPIQMKSPSGNGSQKLKTLLPDSLLREIKNLKFSTNDYEAENEEEDDILPTLKSEMKSDSYDSLSNKDYIKSHEFMQSRKNLNNLPSNMSSSLKRASLPSKTFVLNTEDGTFIDTKMNSMPRTYEADKYYNFHVNEHDNFRTFGNNNNNNGMGLAANGGAGDSLSISEYDSKSIHDDVFAGYRDLRCGSNTSTIRSSKGTVRGVKNRVRNGIATFLQLQQPNIKNYKEKDSGKVVLYTTSMGIIRDTYAKCSNVKQILRTLLVKFEERDVFMSVEYQQEIKERMHSDVIKVPQLYVEGQHIGDADTVERLNESGELRQLLKPYKSISTTYTCQTCGGYRLLPCPSCNGSKKSVHRNHFTAEFVALKCMNCDEVGLVKCHNC